MKLTKAQVKGLFEFPRNDRDLSDILKGQLVPKKKRSGTRKKIMKRNRTRKKIK